MKWAFWRRDADAAQARGARGSDADDGARSDPAALWRVRARRRLIGAAALLLAAIILVPMVLDPAPRPVPDTLPINIPSEKSTFSPRLALPPPPEAGSVPALPPEVGAAGERPIDATKAAPERAAEGEKDASDRSAPSAAAKSAAVAKTEPRSEPKAAARADMDGKAAPGAAVVRAPADAAGAHAKAAEAQRARDILEGRAVAERKAGRYMLQAAALGSEKAAADLAERLKAAGFAPRIEQVSTPDGPRWRVRVGPFASREEADRARAKLRSLEVNATLVAA